AGPVVERDVARDDGDPERLRRERDPLDRLRELPPDLGLLRVAEVEAVGERERLASGAGDVHGGVEHRAPARLARVAAAERRAVERDRDSAPSVDPEDGGVEPRPADGAGADELVVLLEDPRLLLVVDRVDRLPHRGARALIDLVPRAAVGEE